MPVVPVSAKSGRFICYIVPDMRSAAPSSGDHLDSALQAREIRLLDRPTARHPAWVRKVAAWLNTGPATVKFAKALVSLLALLSLATLGGVTIAVMN